MQNTQFKPILNTTLPAQFRDLPRPRERIIQATAPSSISSSHRWIGMNWPSIARRAGSRGFGPVRKMITVISFTARAVAGPSITKSAGRNRISLRE